MVLFCPKCGSILSPKKSRSGKIKMVCTCGYSSKEKTDVLLKEKKILKQQDRISLIDKKLETDPKTKIECPKCSHQEAYYWTLQTRAADEPETTFYKCVKCNHQWRSYD
ncbi:MAG: transcription factor S [Candidatus Woesearchaeota archaeon]|nr:MAG: transcription factor S [Candidatus Woesearchaeota archaeon]